MLFARSASLARHPVQTVDQLMRDGIESKTCNDKFKTKAGVNICSGISDANVF